MIPFAMVVSDKFRESVSKMALAERHQSIETFPFNRADEARRGRSRSVPDTASG
jgi:hypothetical protein